MSDTNTTTKTKAEKTVKAPVACWCGCGGQTRGKFVPGHDARFHGNAKKVDRGLLDAETTLAGLAHDEARTEFQHHIDEAAKTADAWKTAEAEKAQKRAAKAQKKATPPVVSEIETAIVEALAEVLAGSVSDVTPEEVETLLATVDAETVTAA